jgi:hypothetical protein
MSGDPIIDFTSVAERDVFAFCSGLPADGRILLVNQTSGDSADEMAASNGPITFHVSDGVSGGAYCLKAVDSNGGYLAETVQFYIAAPGDPSSSDPL